MLFDDELLTEFADSFFGYGSYCGKYWFVGMEEGGGDSFTDINHRLNVWNERGKQELEDLAMYHQRLGAGCFFNDKPKLQRTWHKLIRIYLSAKGEDVSTTRVREFQKSTLGRKESDIALLELLPLPSPSTKHWFYAQHSELSHLAARDIYHNYYALKRATHIKQRVKHHKPKVVVFYGKGYKEWWQAIADNELHEEKELGILKGRSRFTLFIVTKHPVAMGVTNNYFQEIGQAIAQHNFRSK
ncbi:MAG: hypothetical protein ACLFT0_03735 [Spirulinaceae cyanobacterium]